MYFIQENVFENHTNQAHEHILGNTFITLARGHQ